MFPFPLSMLGLCSATSGAPAPSHQPVAGRPALEYHRRVADGHTRAGSHACHGPGEWAVCQERSPPHAIGSFSPHPRGRPGSSLPTTTRQSCQACGHRGGSELAVVGGNSQIQDGAGGARPRQCPYPELSSPRFQVDVCVRESCQGDLLVFSLLSSHLSGTRSCVSCRVPPSCTGSGLGRTRGGRRERGRNKGVGGRPWKDKED